MNEIGRELQVSELKPAMVVVVKPPEKDIFITVWVRALDAKTVEFYAGEMLWHILNFIMPDGSLVDDKGRVVHVYEYLGEI